MGSARNSQGGSRFRTMNFFVLQKHASTPKKTLDATYLNHVFFFTSHNYQNHSSDKGYANHP